MTITCQDRYIRPVIAGNRKVLPPPGGGRTCPFDMARVQLKPEGLLGFPPGFQALTHFREDRRRPYREQKDDSSP